MSAEKEKKGAEAARSEHGIKPFMLKHLHELFFVSVIVTCICLLSVVVVLTREYTVVLNDQTETRALLCSGDAVEALNERIGNMKFQSVLLACTAAVKPEEKDFIASCLESAALTKYLMKVVYCKDGVLYTMEGGLYESDSNDKLSEPIEFGNVKVLDVVFDTEDIVQRMAICVPLRDHPVADTLIFMYSLNSLREMQEDIPAGSYDRMECLAFCTVDGSIIELLDNKGAMVDEMTKISEGIRIFTKKKEYADALERMLTASESSALTVNADGKDYIVTVSKSHFHKAYCFVHIFDPAKLDYHGYGFVGVILASIVVVLVFMLIFSVYFILSKRSLNRKLSELGTLNEQLQCYTHVGFERAADRMLSQYSNSRFAVVSLQVRRFDYIERIAGKERTLELLRRLRMILNSKMQLGEVYGYEEHGEFLLLLQYGHYDGLVHRLRELYHLANSRLTTAEYNVKLNFGICKCTPGHSNKAAQLISDAKFAMDHAGLERVGGNYTLYEEDMRSTYMEVSDIEIKTDQGIINREFCVFYQPKFNYALGRIDGSEALVRWYDRATDSYLLPGRFIPMQEINGYVSRLDRYIFEEVCRFISKCASAGTPVVPVSVNVSRLTLMEPDFVSYYADVKRKYQIPDRFITLEFTESVACENYAEMTELVKDLHSSGFCCSIDDFGSGYSSYNMLKMLEIDEVKLDRFFLEGCLNNQRARYIIEAAVALGNKLKVKVTQEGVEDEGTFRYLKSIGCDVVQGFYYSKPLQAEAFVQFIQEQLHPRKAES